MTTEQVYRQQLAPIFAHRGKSKHATRRIAAGFSSTTGQHYRAAFDGETSMLELKVLTLHTRRGITPVRGPIPEGADSLPEDIQWRMLDE